LQSYATIFEVDQIIILVTQLYLEARDRNVAQRIFESRIDFYCNVAISLKLIHEHQNRAIAKDTGQILPNAYTLWHS
jgi:hypothetical protein